MHSTVSKRHFLPIKEKGVVTTGKALEDLTPTDPNVIEEHVTKVTETESTGKYQVCVCSSYW